MKRLAVEIYLRCGEWLAEGWAQSLARARTPRSSTQRSSTQRKQVFFSRTCLRCVLERCVLERCVLERCVLERCVLERCVRARACWKQVILMTVLCLLPVACQQQMANQPSPRPDQASEFFPEGQSMRPIVPGTVARGHLHAGQPLFTGTAAGKPDVRAELGAIGASAIGQPEQAVSILAARRRVEVDAFPFPITKAVLKHGQNRYMVYCVVCHDPLGTGQGKIVERGYTPPPSFHTDKLRKAPVGHFFAVITNGYGSMPDYRQQVPPRDRWAIAAYIRALQLSQHCPENQLPPDLKRQLAEQDARQKENHPHE